MIWGYDKDIIGIYIYTYIHTYMHGYIPSAKLTFCYATSPCSWENPLFRLGHFPVRKL